MIWLGVAFGGMAECEALYAADPGDLAVWQCVHQAGNRGELEDALSFTRRTLESGAVVGQIHLTHANLLGRAGRTDEVVPALDAALRSFELEGDVPGQVKSRLNLANELRHQGRTTDGEAQLLAAATVARDAEPFASMVAIERARWTCDVGGDYAEALRLLLPLGPRLVDDGFPSHGKVLIHHTRRCLASRLGRDAEARFHGEALVDLAEELGNPVLAAVTRDNLLWDELSAGRVGSDFDDRVAATLAAARAVGHDPTVADLVCLQAERDAADDFSDCLDHAATGPIAARAWTLATHRALLQDDLPLAQTRLARAVELADGTGALEARIEAAVARSAVADRVDPQAALQHGRTALELVRDLRERQVDALVRSRFVTSWSGVYERQAERLRAVGDIAGAITVIERLRGYRSLERLDRAAATPALRPDDDAWRRRDELLRVIQDLTESGDQPDRLKAVEREEAALREELLASVPAFAQLRSLQVDLPAVQATLADDDALVMPVLSERPWMAVIRRDGVHAVDLPGWSGWADRVQVMASLLRAGDPLADHQLPDLSAALVGPVADLLVDVRRLVVVTDPAVHHLPWTALHLDGAALGERFAVSYAPSLRTWVALRQRTSHPTGTTVVISEPTRPGVERLPGAWSEGRRVASLAPGAVVTFGGTDAREDALRAALQTPIRLLHVAAHATVDPVDPERSAVLLSSESPGDGLLQLREVVGLPLDGAVVVLAACRGADGEAGAEGVTGLAEAFLQAGARAVVASTAPLGDQVAESLFVDLHERLAGGSRLDEGLAGALRSQPAARGVRIIGDGAVRLPGRSSSSWWWLTTIGVLLVGGGAAVVWSRR